MKRRSSLVSSSLDGSYFVTDSSSGKDNEESSLASGLRATASLLLRLAFLASSESSVFSYGPSFELESSPLWSSEAVADAVSPV